MGIKVRAIDGGQILKGFAFTLRNLKIILKAVGMIVDAIEESDMIELLFFKKNKLSVKCVKNGLKWGRTGVRVTDRWLWHWSVECA